MSDLSEPQPSTGSDVDDAVVVETVVETVVVIESVDADGTPVDTIVTDTVVTESLVVVDADGSAEVIDSVSAETITVEEVMVEEIRAEARPAAGALEARPASPAIAAAATPTPISGPRPSPARLRPAAPAAASAAPPKRVTDPAKFGRIDADGTAYLSTPEGDIAVGNWAAGTTAEGLAFFGRKYDDILVEVDLAAHRLRDGRGRVDQAQAAVQHARDALAAPSFIGDVTQLAAACDEVDSLIAAQQAQREEARRLQKAAALESREAIVAEAESLAGSHQWKATGERFAALLEEWKAAPRIDRGREQAMWKRFSAARTHFDKARRSHFAALESERKDAVAAKQAIIAKARILSVSTDWADTSRSFRDLMTQWKAAGHAGRQEEDRLWAEFRGLQEAFFAARTAANAERDTELQGNLELKQALLVEAEAIDPTADLASAKRALRSIQDRWDTIGFVPRADRDRVEGRLRAVEERIRKLDQDRWRATNPEARARAEDTAGKFRAALAKSEKALAEAQARGDQKATAEAQRTVESTRALLAAAEGAASEFS